MDAVKKEREIHLVFVISVVLKALGAFLEIIGGVLLLFTGATTHLIEYLINNELVEDPGDFLANTIQHLVPYLREHSQLFAAFYLLSHGVIKFFLSIGLLRRWLWTYPAAIVVFALFIVYQLYRYTHTHSIFLILLTIFDAIVIWLTWHEYKYMKEQRILVGPASEIRP